MVSEAYSAKQGGEVKKIRKNTKTNVFLNASPVIKMSELVGEYARDYIQMGETTEERQNYLNAACTAWNIANAPDNRREKALRQLAEEYKKMNPGVDDVDEYLHDMEMLIQKKLQMFPNVKKTIVDAFIKPIKGTQYKISIVSTNDPKALSIAQEITPPDHVKPCR